MNQGKVLVVEDDKSVLAVLRGLLEEDGYWVRAVETGQRARAELMENDFDVCLVDINLPDMDGLELLKETKENGSTASIIIMTAR
ncbi:MAG TPA: response regulator, partial [Candidatus Binatia bacterium]